MCVCCCHRCFALYVRFLTLACLLLAPPSFSSPSLQSLFILFCCIHHFLILRISPTCLLEMTGGLHFLFIY
ncbi:unnamed protein product [Meloidogyne enterolobii]|uniref:Uncharacterized protein n=1 Tax=Meloidogyne enterolobii TaxID=390850 RepID=A0ACB0YYI1_MELEN